MSRSILVTYATRYGSTQEVAETIAAVLREEGLEVDIQPMREVGMLGQYDAVVLGAAIYSARWHPDAHQFLALHREALRQRPVAIFALGPLTTDDAAMQRSRHQLEQELEKYPWLKPAALEMFVGRQAPAKLGIFARFRPAVDHRNWEAIRAWAGTLPALLQPVVTVH